MSDPFGVNHDFAIALVLDGVGQCWTGRRQFVAVIFGFHVSGVPDGGAVERLGLRSGDVITVIGGVELTSFDGPLEALTRLQRAREIEVRVNRRGRRITLQLELIRRECLLQSRRVFSALWQTNGSKTSNINDR